MADIARKRWAQRAQALQFTQLDQIRVQAEKWRNALVAITALLAVASVVKGPERIADLSTGGRRAVMILSGGAFLLLVAGSLTAMRAAFGMPRRMRLTGENLQRWEAEEAGFAVCLLRIARVLSVTGLLGVAAAIGVTWSSPAPAAAAKVAVQTVDDRLFCGELVEGTGQWLIVKAESVAGTVRRVIPYDEIVTMKTVAKCT